MIDALEMFIGVVLVSLGFAIGAIIFATPTGMHNARCAKVLSIAHTARDTATVFQADSFCAEMK